MRGSRGAREALRAGGAVWCEFQHAKKRLMDGRKEKGGKHSKTQNIIIA